MNYLSYDKSPQWEEKANKNIDKWGKQNPETILLAMMEELGELSQAYLQYKENPRIPGRRQRIQEELDDLAPLMYQFQEHL